MLRHVLPLVMSFALLASSSPAAFARDSDGQLNFKIYSPEGSHAPAPQEAEPKESQPQAEAQSEPAKELDTSALQAEKPMEDVPVETETQTSSEKPSPASDTQPIEGLIDTGKKSQPDESTSPVEESKPAETAATDDKKPATTKVLQGYIRVVPTGTKIPIIMDTAIDSDTSQEGDEFSARTGEDLTIDGQTAVPAGSIIKGRIARLNAPRALNRSGSVALKFDTVTTPDNRQIPIVANLVARGGVVHAKRGLKDIVIDAGAVTLPTAAGLGIGLLAGSSTSSTSSIGAAGAAAIGAAVGGAVGLAIILSKKGKRVDVKPGDELKIELAEDLRMPMM